MRGSQTGRARYPGTGTPWMWGPRETLLVSFDFYLLNLSSYWQGDSTMVSIFIMSVIRPGMARLVTLTIHTTDPVCYQLVQPVPPTGVTKVVPCDILSV